MKITGTIKLFTLLSLGIILNAGCNKKDQPQPPVINLKTGAGYTSMDANVLKNTTIKVGIVADKVSADMVTYSIEFQYDGTTTTTTAQTFALTGTDQQHYDKDITFNIRNVVGYERWTFTITDSNGGVTKKLLVFNVF